MYTIISPPTAEPIAFAEMQTHLRITDSNEQTDVERYTRAARRYAERFMHRALVTQRIRTNLTAFANEIIMPPSPLAQVESVKYVDSDGATQTLATTVYQIDTLSEPGRIKAAYGQSWPSIRAGDFHPVYVQHIAGYAAPFTCVATTNICTVASRTYSDGDRVRVSNSGGALPTGLSADADYFVISATGNGFQLATATGGGAVVLTTTGSGTNFMGEVPETIRNGIKILTAHWYEAREPIIVGTIVANVPVSVIDMLTLYRLPETD